jgi:hypothetical protein
MAKNYKSIYTSTNDSNALEQAIYLKKETTKGTLIAPQATDFLFTLPGGQISFSQPFESSMQRSGRHHTSIIKKKKECSWNFNTYFNIDEGLGSASSAEIDTPVRQLFKSLFGKEVTSSGAVYTTAETPDETFTIFEVGDKWCRQTRGCFVMGGTINLPGDGEATVEWTGNGSEAFLIGIGKSILDNNGGNTVTVGTGEGKRFKVGGLVMLVEADGTTRSADTVAGSARVITGISGDVITLNGAVLADADGSGLGAEIYLCYYEAATKTAINNPVTGLVGSMSFADLTGQCFRSAKISVQNDHELANYCYGTDALAAPFFVPANRVTAEVTVEMNMNDKVLAFFNEVQSFDAKDFTAILGDAAGRHMVVTCPNIFFSVPTVATPDSGSIPVAFTGNAYQTAIDAADEITVSFV